MNRRLTTVLLAASLPLAFAQAAPTCPAAHAGISDLGYSSYRDGAHFRGTAVDVLEELYKRTGCGFDIEWYPRGRLFAQFANGQVDVTASSLRTPERDRSGTWLPYSSTQFELVLLNRAAGKFHSLADFVDRSTARLNVTRGISYTPEVQVQLDRLQRQGRLEYVNDYVVVFRKIQARRAEGTLAPPTIHVMHQRQFNMTGKMTAMPVEESPRSLIGLYISNKVPTEVVRRYAEGLRSMVADGTVQKFYEHYLGEAIGHRIFSNGSRDILDAMPDL